MRACARARCALLVLWCCSAVAACRRNDRGRSLGFSTDAVCTTTCQNTTTATTTTTTITPQLGERASGSGAKGAKEEGGDDDDDTSAAAAGGRDQGARGGGAGAAEGDTVAGAAAGASGGLGTPAAAAVYDRQLELLQRGAGAAERRETLADKVLAPLSGEEPGAGEARAREIAR